MEYSTLSKELTSKLSKTEKKNNGIYFTPPSCVNYNLQLLEPYLKNVVEVLEPSCGSGEYITALQRGHPKLKITGIEFNETIFESILSLKNENVNLIHEDYLKYKTSKLYDLILGNPPYLVMKKGDVHKEYYDYFEGRPNIFILFLVKSLHLLKEGGILSFVLPKNFLNCLYYDKTRKYISKHFQILYIVDCNEKYIETQQETVILILQKPVQNVVVKNDKFILNVANYTIFTNETNLIKLKDLYKKSKSLDELGFKVSVGTVVWNQVKSLLTIDDTKTRLIYSSDIHENKLKFKNYTNDEKKNFINKPGISRPMILLNRGYGVGEYKFNYCLIDEKKEYLVENHLICIEYKDETLTREEMIQKYEKIICSLNDKRTLEFVPLYFGNNAINTTELNFVLPVYQDV